MPIDYKKYPANWKTEIRPKIMRRAGEVRNAEGVITTQACCEWCGIRNKMWASYFRPDPSTFLVKNLYDGELYELAPEGKLVLSNQNCPLSEWPGDKGRIICLTIAHIVPDKDNCEDSNLAALCQKCHLNHDREHHMKNARETRRRKRRQMELF